MLTPLFATLHKDMYLLLLTQPYPHNIPHRGGGRGQENAYLSYWMQPINHYVSRRVTSFVDNPIFVKIMVYWGLYAATWTTPHNRCKKFRVRNSLINKYMRNILYNIVYEQVHPLYILFSMWNRNSKHWRQKFKIHAIFPSRELLVLSVYIQFWRHGYTSNTPLWQYWKLCFHLHLMELYN